MPDQDIVKLLERIADSLERLAPAPAPHADLDAISARCSSAHFEVIPNTDHFFMTSLGDLGKSATTWLERG